MLEVGDLRGFFVAHCHDDELLVVVKDGVQYNVRPDQISVRHNPDDEAFVIDLDA